jgi:hypothetical protein
MNNPRDKLPSIKLYTFFGILTVELIDMLEKYGNDEIDEQLQCLTNIQQVSSRDVTEKFFQIIDFNTSDGKFKSYSRVLKSLGKIHDVSLFEIHQRILRINTMSYDDGYDEWCNRKQDIFNLLLDISCFENEEIALNFKRIFFTKDKIDEEFHKEIEYLDKKSALFLRDNPFCTDFSSTQN